MNKKFNLSISGGLLLLLNGLFAQTPGTLDPGFGNNGIVITPYNFIEGFQDVVVQSDGKIVAGGMSFDNAFQSTAYIARYMNDGTADASFGQNGVFTFNQDFEANIFGIAIDSEGRIIAAGSTTDYQIYRMMVLRLLPDGTLDNSFNGNGVLYIDGTNGLPFGESHAHEVALDANDNIFVAGRSFNTEYNPRPVVVKITPDGTVDTSFGNNGIAEVTPIGGNNRFNTIMVAPDGKIVAGGTFEADLLYYVSIVARFNPDGTLDDSFGNGGKELTSLSNVDDQIWGMGYTPEGKIVVSGALGSVSFAFNMMVMQLNDDGSPDTAFGEDGAVIFSSTNFDVSEDMVVMPDGKILVVGTTGDGPPNEYDMTVWRFNPDGTPDDTFGNNGVSVLPVQDYKCMLLGVALDAEGNAILAGRAWGPEHNDFLIARIDNSIISSVQNRQGVEQVKLYPNPASVNDFVSVSLPATMSGQARVQIFDMKGTMVASVSIAEVQGNLARVQLPSLVSGIYQVQVSTPNGIMATTKLVVVNQ